VGPVRTEVAGRRPRVSAWSTPTPPRPVRAAPGRGG